MAEERRNLYLVDDSGSVQRFTKALSRKDLNSPIAGATLAHFVNEDKYEALDEESRKHYVYVGFAHGYRRDDRMRARREQKIAIVVLLAIFIAFSGIGVYGILTENDPLEIVGLCAAIPTLFGLLIQLAVHLIA